MDEFKKVCQESATKQREELEFGNVKRGRNDETADKSPSVVLAPKKNRTSDSRTSRSLQGSSQSIAPKPWTFNTIPNALLSSNCPRPLMRLVPPFVSSREFYPRICLKRYQDLKPKKLKRLQFYLHVGCAQ